MLFQERKFQPFVRPFIILIPGPGDYDSNIDDDDDGSGSGYPGSEG